MVNVAIVGYRRLPQSRGPDELIDFIPRELEDLENLHFCYVGIVEDMNGRDIDKLVKEMLDSNPDVLHYANYRDPYPPKQLFDETYIKEVQKQRYNLPILLTSSHHDAEEFAKRLGIHYMVFIDDLVQQYADKLKEIRTKKEQLSLNHTIPNQSKSIPNTTRNSNITSRITTNRQL